MGIAVFDLAGQLAALIEFVGYTVGLLDLSSSLSLPFSLSVLQQNHILVLPNLVKFCEICESRDQIKWIKERTMRLQEQIAMDDTISHQVGKIKHCIAETAIENDIGMALIFPLSQSFVAAHNLLTVPRPGTADTQLRGAATLGRADWQCLLKEFALLHTHCGSAGTALPARVLQQNKHGHGQAER